MLKPLELAVEQYGSDGECVSNIEYALSLGLEEVNLGLVRHDGTFVVVGSGPSLSQNLPREDFLAGRAICAVNGAHNVLVENGITPSLWLTVDPQPMTGHESRPEVNNIRDPQPGTIYCLASRNHPSVFDYLEGQKRILWHCWGEESENEILKQHHKMSIGGGTTSGLRAINFGYCQGFRKFKLYGFDSCLGERGEKHVYEKPLDPHIQTIDIHVGDRQFLCNMAMAQQAQEFQTLYEVMPDASIEVVGGGLIAAIIEERKAKGLHT